ncbi:sensor histidine kinase [Metabacillus halosaccharovorans]|uniref:sensor histidine kinase n=1 Tax=Metabacillus halosaccharovorans TaxID=930124 RepID=UPI0009951F2F|nr:ATP-binding protein [Metabacillus halosaccharovorans]
MKRKKKSDLFIKTQHTLTIKYSLLILLFLFLFIILLYAIAYFWFTAAEKNELREMALNEVESVEHLLDKPNDRMREPQFLTVNSNQLFYYVFNTKGELVIQNEQLSLFKSDFLNLVNDWTPEREQIQTADIKINHDVISKHKKGDQFSTYVPKNEKIKVMMIAEPIYERNQIIGYLYLGRDITDLAELLQGLFIILLVLIVLFSCIAYYFSFVMSKRAMVPIRHAFKRQQDFVADASHELRTPLSVMLSSIEILEMEKDQLSHMPARMVDNVKEEVKRMTGLVGDLLTLARSDTDDPKQMSFERFDLQSVAEKTILSFEPHALEKNIQLNLDVQSSITVFGQKERLTQLLYILLDNATKYSPENGSVKLHVWKEKDNVFISVSDTGIGIAQKDLPYIFERFYRVDRARTRQNGGHGLGLSIAKWIVDLHGGQINVESKLNKGTTFIVKLPPKG